MEYRRGRHEFKPIFKLQAGRKSRMHRLKSANISNGWVGDIRSSWPVNDIAVVAKSNISCRQILPAEFNGGTTPLGK